MQCTSFMHIIIIDPTNVVPVLQSHILFLRMHEIISTIIPTITLVVRSKDTIISMTSLKSLGISFQLHEGTHTTPS